MGDSATITSAGKRLEARISGVVGALDPLSRTARIRLSPAIDKTKLRPGAAVQVEFKVRHTGRGVVVSRDALIVGPVSTKLFKVSDGRAEVIEVEILATAEANALVIARGKGKRLEKGEKIVIRGNERLRPGQRVRESE